MFSCCLPTEARGDFHLLNDIESRFQEVDKRLTEAETQAKEAETKAREAETQAKEAETKAREAETQAKEAETKAREAETKAKEAETQAKEAETKADEAFKTCEATARETSSHIRSSYATQTEVGDALAAMDVEMQHIKNKVTKVDSVIAETSRTYATQTEVEDALASIEVQMQNIKGSITDIVQSHLQSHIADRMPEAFQYFKVYEKLNLTCGKYVFRLYPQTKIFSSEEDSYDDEKASSYWKSNPENEFIFDWMDKEYDTYFPIIGYATSIVYPNGYGGGYQRQAWSHHKVNLPIFIFREDGTCLNTCRCNPKNLTQRKLNPYYKKVHAPSNDYYGRVRWGEFDGTYHERDFRLYDARPDVFYFTNLEAEEFPEKFLKDNRNRFPLLNETHLGKSNDMLIFLSWLLPRNKEVGANKCGKYEFTIYSMNGIMYCTAPTLVRRDPGPWVAKRAKQIERGGIYKTGYDSANESDSDIGPDADLPVADGHEELFRKAIDQDATWEDVMSFHSVGIVG